jgi:hypothetical protein
MEAPGDVAMTNSVDFWQKVGLTLIISFAALGWGLITWQFFMRSSEARSRASRLYGHLEKAEERIEPTMERMDTAMESTKERMDTAREKMTSAAHTWHVGSVTS